VLGAYPPKLSEAAKKSLQERHVDVRVNTLVTSIDARGVTVKGKEGEERIGTRTVLWAAGVQASPLATSLGVPLERSGRVIVEPDLSIPGHPEIFVVGDLAKMISDGAEVPGVAQGALQGGRHVAKIITAEARAKLRNRPQPTSRPAFHYRDKGNMATIGRAEAVIATKHFARHGFFAWMLWWIVHIFFLVGFRNRIFMMFHWGWSWLTYKRGSRLITGSVGELPAVRTIAADGTVSLPPAGENIALPEEPPSPAPPPS
jgi:NADH:ubiquinone reductase (H+-translocating)